MGKYVYPAVLTPEGEAYSVTFPDLEGCFTCGDNLPDALYMAEDVLSLYLIQLEDNRMEIPLPTLSQTAKPGTFVTLIRCNTDIYRKRISKSAAKKHRPSRMGERCGGEKMK